jgi:tRNA threonylcarbamoyladenosine biosynthesis protein TsaE
LLFADCTGVYNFAGPDAAGPRTRPPTGGTAHRMHDVAPAERRAADSAQADDLFCVALTSMSAEETQQYGAITGQLLRPGDLVLLQGPIGAGKTCFTQGLARGMGLSARVTSPSFTLANVYEPTSGGFPLYHLDLWRITSPLEALGIGLEEYLAAEGVCVVEWPGVAEVVLPDEHLLIRFTVVGDGRVLDFGARGARPRALLADLRAAFEKQSARGGARAPRD